MHYRNMQELLGNISPDVLVDDDKSNIIIHTDSESTAKLRVAPSNRKVLEDKFLDTWEYLGGQELAREFRFHPTRLWRFDFAIPEQKIAFEIQGGIYAQQSGHRSFEGVQRDYEKFNAATLLGWRVFQVTSPMMKDADFMAQIVAFCK